MTFRNSPIAAGFNRLNRRLMRILLAAAALARPSRRVAETHVFIIENHSDYGVDQCLASGARCGKVVASAYCQSRSYQPGGIVPEGRSGRNYRRSIGPPAAAARICGDWVAIECTR